MKPDYAALAREIHRGIDEYPLPTCGAKDIEAALEEAWALGRQSGRREANEGDHEIGAGLLACSECPPLGYPTDKTRCDECPRRLHSTTPAKGEEI